MEVIPTLKAEEILPHFLRQFVVLIENPKLMEPHYEVRIVWKTVYIDRHIDVSIFIYMKTVYTYLDIYLCVDMDRLVSV